jgi:hypothetical protein
VKLFAAVDFGYLFRPSGPRLYPFVVLDTLLYIPQLHSNYIDSMQIASSGASCRVSIQTCNQHEPSAPNPMCKEGSASMRYNPEWRSCMAR